MSWPTQPTKRNPTPTGSRQPPAGGPDKPKTAGQPNVPPRATWLAFLVILLMNYLLVRLFLPGPDEPVTIPYTVFKEEASKGHVLAI